jgi:hypothetical protein
MRSFTRMVIASVLCLLLPLQAGASVMRSAVMSAAHATQAGAQKNDASLQLAHAIGVPHQHGAHAHQHKLPNKKAGKAAKPASTQQVKAACHDGAQCCLHGASAPPTVNPLCINPAIARIAYRRHSVPAVLFITEGPERPPRFLA